MEPRGFAPWDVVAICGVLVGVAYLAGSNSTFPEESQPAPLQAAEQGGSVRDEELERLRRAYENDVRQTAAELQRLTLELQTVDASRKLERQALEQQRADLQEELQDSQAKWRQEVESRESLEEKLDETKDQLRDLEQDYQALERRFDEQLSSLRASDQTVNFASPSPRVAAESLGYSESQTPQEARVQEWRRSFQRGQEARDAYNAWLATERESEFLWAASLVRLEDGGTIEWPSLLRGNGFAAHRSQAELALKMRDLEKLCAAADGALVLLESQARSHGRDADAYLSAKRFLSVLRQLEL